MLKCFVILNSLPKPLWTPEGINCMSDYQYKSDSKRTSRLLLSIGSFDMRCFMELWYWTMFTMTQKLCCVKEEPEEEEIYLDVVEVIDDDDQYEDAREENEEQERAHIASYCETIMSCSSEVKGFAGRRILLHFVPLCLFISSLTSFLTGLLHCFSFLYVICHYIPPFSTGLRASYEQNVL